MPEFISVITKEEIHKKIVILASKISEDYHGRNLLLIGVLKGAFIFLSDLARALTIPVQIDFVRASSYGDSMVSSGKIELTHDVQIDLKGKHVILVEDIVDSGKTISYLKDYFLSKEPESVKICAFVDKYERRETDLNVDYSCLMTKEGFLVGYGLDYAENYRELQGIYHLKL